MILHIMDDYVLHRTYVREKENGSSFDESRFICKCQIFIFKNPVVYDDRILCTNYVLHKKYVGNLDFSLAPRSIEFALSIKPKS